MSQDQVDEKDSSPKSRILRLFRFLYEVNRLRNRPERTLQEQVFVVPLSRLPEHPGHELRSALDKALQSAIRQDHIVFDDEMGKGGLLYSTVRTAGSAAIKLRSRGPRTFEEIPASELQTVAKYLLQRNELESGSDGHLRAILEAYDLKRLTTQVGTSLLEIIELRLPYVDEHLRNL